MGYWKVKHNQDKSKPISERRIANVLFKKEASGFDLEFWLVPGGRIIPTHAHAEAVIAYILTKAHITEAISDLTKQSLQEYGDKQTLLIEKGIPKEEADLLITPDPADLRNFALMELNWIRVSGRDIQVRSLNAKTIEMLDTLCTIFKEMYGEERCYRTSFNLELSDGRFFQSIPFEALEDFSGLAEFRDPFHKLSQLGTVSHGVPVGRFWITDEGKTLPIDNGGYHERVIQDRVRKKPAK